VKRSWIKQGRRPGFTATAVLVLVWLGAVLAVLQGFVHLCVCACCGGGCCSRSFQLWRHRLTVEDVRQESPDVISVLMSGQHLDELRAQPGQFFRWRFLTAKTWRSAYPFSLSAVPTCNRLRITVKVRGDGTRRIFSIPVGTLVFAEGPYGVLTTRRRRRPRVLLIAGGVGITPMRALFEVIDLPGKDVTLVYRASCERDLVFKDELDEITERSGARVVYLVGPSTRRRPQQS
jgi:ferredoxin-NADP reductase